MILSCKCCGEGLAEIKCPQSICETVPSHENLPYLVETHNGSMLKRTHKYFTQIQGQLALAKRNYAWFFVYTHHGYHLEKILFDENYWLDILQNLDTFWFKYFCPNLLSKAEVEKSNIDFQISASTSTSSTNNETLVAAIYDEHDYCKKEAVLSKVKLPKARK